MTFETNWSEHQVETLKQMWGGDHPVSVIAAKVSKTAQAVGRKRMRLKLRSRLTPESAAVALPPIPAVRVQSQNVSLMKRTGCCFITSDAKPHKYCNAQVKAVRADGMWQYCSAHTAVLRNKGGNFHPKDVRKAAIIRINEGITP
jgi:hypothetical protein